MKVGDYVRTNKGEIGKVISIANDNDFGLGKEYSGFVAFNTEPYVYGDVIKSSPNIIDLIEVGDYVNGYQVIEKPYIYHDVQFVSVDTQDSWNWGKGEMPIDGIKSIITKEQFESMEYRIKE